MASRAGRGVGRSSKGSGASSKAVAPAVHPSAPLHDGAAHAHTLQHCGAALLAAPLVGAAPQQPGGRPLVARAGPPGAAVQAGLEEFIAAGPLLRVCGLGPDHVAEHRATWECLGRRLAEQLGFDHDAMDDVQRLRVYHYYLPVYFWVDGQLQQHRAAAAAAAADGAPPPPLVLGISAPQGCGKSTLVEQLGELFDWLGVRAASVSVDDFYLTRSDQAALAAAAPDNRLLQLRGNAGSHDLELGRGALAALRGLTRPGDTVAVPRYDKSAYGGLGDRADPSAWPTVEGPLDIVLFEGWMLGFSPVGPEAAAAADASLPAVDAALGAYRDAWDAAVDSWLVIRIGDPQWVFGWRLQAEQRMRAAGKPGMSDEAIADFVSRYIPAYTAYLPGLYAAGPTTAAPGRTLILEVDAARAPVAQQPEPVL
ncbi:MAG: hypothetical protein J3K34DRAFT_454677 [Monoraphidium minutum]|nr:MAG: hypothetical protein J3K34DRAFT_454677 [Monoraphidium minutum]